MKEASSLLLSSVYNFNFKFNLQKNLLCIGTEEGLLEIHSLFHKKLIKSMNAHKSRLKCMSSFSKGKINDKEKKIENFIVTADSKGVIKLWSLKVK